jgi:hypothetical protein
MVEHSREVGLCSRMLQAVSVVQEIGVSVVEGKRNNKCQPTSVLRLNVGLSLRDVIPIAGG